MHAPIYLIPNVDWKNQNKLILQVVEDDAGITSFIFSCLPQMLSIMCHVNVTMQRRLRHIRMCKKTLCMIIIDDDVNFWLFPRTIIIVVVFVVEVLFFDKKDALNVSIRCVDWYDFINSLDRHCETYDFMFNLFQQNHTCV